MTQADVNSFVLPAKASPLQTHMSLAFAGVPLCEDDARLPTYEKSIAFAGGPNSLCGPLCEDGARFTTYFSEQVAFVCRTALGEAEDDVVSLRAQLQEEARRSTAAEVQQLKGELRRHQELRESDEVRHEQTLLRRNKSVQELQKICKELQAQCRTRGALKQKPKRVRELTVPEAEIVVKGLAASWDAVLDYLPDGEEKETLDATFWRRFLGVAHDDKFRTSTDDVRQQIRTVFSAASAEKQQREDKNRKTALAGA